MTPLNNPLGWAMAIFSSTHAGAVLVGGCLCCRDDHGFDPGSNYWTLAIGPWRNYRPCVHGDHHGDQTRTHPKIWFTVLGPCSVEPWWFKGLPKSRRWTFGLWPLSGITLGLSGITLGTIPKSHCFMTNWRSEWMVHASTMSLPCWKWSFWCAVLSRPSPSLQFDRWGSSLPWSTKRRNGNPMRRMWSGIAGISASS